MKIINSLIVHHDFTPYNIEMETYEIVFTEFFFFRSIKINGSSLIKSHRLWKGSLIYPLTILPWITHRIDHNELEAHIRILNGEEPIRLVTDSNVIRKSRSFWNKSTENQNEV
jgi:hypothetical protein